ncbi:FliH/SctL family protein [Pokkaliibacter sp. CJK22405]|uniref:FliH/SctL family protein n=1 Tax=Pokkaliibacter sp. CJK22405 TaxID=3384615 RepID=UPI003984AE8B
MSKSDKVPHRIPAGSAESYNRWQLPDVGESDFSNEEPVYGLNIRRKPPEPEVIESLEEEEEPEVPLITLEQLEAIRQDAHDEGYAEGKETGYQEGFSQGEQAGFASGQEKGHKEAFEAEQQRIINAEAWLKALGQQFMEPIQKQDEALISSLATVVKRMAEAVIQRELATSDKAVRTLAEQVINELPDPAVEARVQIHPDDREPLQKVLTEQGLSWHLEDNPELQQGGFFLRTPYSFVDATLGPRMNAVFERFSQQHELSASRLSTESIEPTKGASEEVSDEGQSLPSEGNGEGA